MTAVAQFLVPSPAKIVGRKELGYYTPLDLDGISKLWLRVPDDRQRLQWLRGTPIGTK